VRLSLVSSVGRLVAGLTRVMVAAEAGPGARAGVGGSCAPDARAGRGGAPGACERVGTRADVQGDAGARASVPDEAEGEGEVSEENEHAGAGKPGNDPGGGTVSDEHVGDEEAKQDKEGHEGEGEAVLGAH